MNRLIILLVTSFIIITTIIGLAKPQLHKPLMFAEADTEVENISEEIVETKSPIIEDTNIPVMEIEIKPQSQKTQTAEQKIKLQPQKTEIQEKPIEVKIAQQPKTQPVKEIKPTLPKSVQDIVNKKPTAEVPKPVVKTEQPKTEPEIVLPKKEEPKTVLTEEEEVILWNKWRSDLQNQVMRDARIAAPMGTRFRFSFTVDKFGNISNLRVWSDTSYYTPHAIQSIKPVLLSYQHKNILKFPQGTKRVTTNVTGGFVISNYDKYSRPDDYADVEKIRRLKNVQM